MSEWAKLEGEELVMKVLGAIDAQREFRLYDDTEPHPGIESIPLVLLESHDEGGIPGDTSDEISDTVSDLCGFSDD
jgi:hypothetical protein